MRKEHSYKSIVILLVILILSIIFIQRISAQGINLAASSNGSVASLVAGTQVWGSPQGSTDNINDENASTYYGRTNSCFAERTRRCTATAGFTAEVVFTEIVAMLDRIDYQISLTASGTWDISYYCKIYVHQGGVWTYAGQSSSSGTNSVSGPWANVDKIRAELYANAEKHREPFSGTATAIARLYELKAFGEVAPSYTDIGLRVYDENVTEPIKIAVWPEGEELNSPLRVAKNGKIWGIVLVNPGDQNDSGVRIQTSSGVKALRKLNN